MERGDRVLLYMQNSPQLVLAFYAILRADAVVVPVNPMNRTAELRHYVDDSGATTAFVAQDLLDADAAAAPPRPDRGLQHLIVATYSDYLTRPTELRVPDFVAAPRDVPAVPGVIALDRRAAPQATLRARSSPGPTTSA